MCECAGDGDRRDGVTKEAEVWKEGGEKGGSMPVGGGQGRRGQRAHFQVNYVTC